MVRGKVAIWFRRTGKETRGSVDDNLDGSLEIGTLIFVRQMGLFCPGSWLYCTIVE